MHRALVCGAGGFIGGHLVSYLKSRDYWVRGVDVKSHEFAPTQADEFRLLDLRMLEHCHMALSLEDGDFDEVYQLAADMGGMGFIHSAECDIMCNNALININMIDTAARARVPRYFFSSSVCVYRDMQPGEPMLTESDAIPANPDNEYGWEKLYAERMVQTYARHYPIETRIARFKNCYGPLGTWTGGREKAPAAICRKVAQAPDGGTIEVWGDGSAVRSYTYVTDTIRGVYALMQSDLSSPVNIGSPQFTTVDELVNTVIQVSGKEIHVKHVDGPMGVRSRNFSSDRAYSLGWRANVSLEEGIGYMYPWVLAQVNSQVSSQEDQNGT